MSWFPSSWFGIALTGMFSFACMSLVFKKLTYLLPTPVILLYVFICMSVLCLTNNFRQGIKPELTWQTALMILFASVCAFIGNLADVEALRLAPNPGYASAVKAGQIIVITFLSLILFPDTKLSFQGVCGVLLVLSGVGLLALQK